MGGALQAIITIFSVACVLCFFAEEPAFAGSSSGSLGGLIGLLGLGGLALFGLKSTPRSDEEPEVPSLTPISSETATSIISKQRGRQPQDVDVSVFAPRVAKPGDQILVQVFLHPPEREQEAQARAMHVEQRAELLASVPLTLPLRQYDKLKVTLDCDMLMVKDRVQNVIWNARLVCVYFEIEILKAFVGNLSPKLRVFVNGAPAGYIIFELKVDSDAPAFAPTLAQTEVHSYQKPFLSYAHEDREEVLKAAQLLRALKIDCFQDLLSLAPGEQFEERLFSEIEHCDVFLLFWSHNAQNSKWVIREAEYALQRSMRAPGRKALDIIPVLLEGPPPPIPPASLGKINFSDPIRHIIFAEENSQKEQRQKEHDKLERAAALRAFNEKTGPWLYPLLFFGGIFLLTAILIATR
jgi:hypothetical protein